MHNHLHERNFGSTSAASLWLNVYQTVDQVKHRPRPLRGASTRIAHSVGQAPSAIRHPAKETASCSRKARTSLQPYMSSCTNTD